MRFSVESWSPQYGASITSATVEETDDQVDLTAERDLSDWNPIDTAPAIIPNEIVFIDGIQRIDARIWIHDRGVSVPGVCVSVAAGAVVCRRDGATVHGVQVARALIAPAASSVETITTRHATYPFMPAGDETPEAAYLAIHRFRHELESDVARSVTGDLVVFDGPLRGRSYRQGVGYVKTHHKLYLPEPLQPVVGSLGDGERTPIFHLASGPGGSRWSWYLRLPGPISHPWSGIVRMELPGARAAADAATRASFVSSCLPRFASQPHRESRAPQNLYPIAGLERQLRRRLGDPVLLERELRIMSTTGTSAGQ